MGKPTISRTVSKVIPDPSFGTFRKRPISSTCVVFFFILIKQRELIWCWEQFGEQFKDDILPEAFAYFEGRGESGFGADSDDDDDDDSLDEEDDEDEDEIDLEEDEKPKKKRKVCKDGCC